MAGPDVGPAGEADQTVDDHDLAVVPEVRVAEQARHESWQEALGAHAHLPELRAHIRPAVARAQPVDEHPDGDTPRLGAEKGVPEREPDLVHVEYVSKERNGFFRAVDRLEHRGESAVPVAQGLHGVAGVQGPAADMGGKPIHADQASMGS